ncbi:MAG: DUF2225 domain-containing protein [Spirochaetaceae bacterium]|jgi:uncharacterized protein (DUF2225 family)|nr:DUF2225 domain-containing protein [Spirochaetaceae bacterium]
MAAEDLKVSYLSKDEIICPVCETAFQREELLSGGGRLIAGAITDELHRLYEPSARYGDVYPLAYQSTVCPECWYASMEKDFSLLPPSARDQVTRNQHKRKFDISRLFPDLDFFQSRGLVSGAAAQYLTVVCYDYFPRGVAPTIKQGIASLRASWLFEELDKKFPGQHYDWLSTLFKKKARFFYIEALNREQAGLESIGDAKNLGPDTDKNFGYEGVLYLSALLSYRYGPVTDSAHRISYLGNAKRTIAKMFGLGKSSKSKPGPLLEHARNIYDRINQELNESDD